MISDDAYSEYLLLKFVLCINLPIEYPCQYVMHAGGEMRMRGGTRHSGAPNSNLELEATPMVRPW